MLLDGLIDADGLTDDDAELDGLTDRLYDDDGLTDRELLRWTIVLVIDDVAFRLAAIVSLYTNAPRNPNPAG